MPGPRPGRWALALLALVALSFAVDRLTLWAWQVRVKKFCARLQREAPAFHATPGRAIGWRPRNDADTDPWMFVSFEGTSVRPDGINIDPGKGLRLIFLPPSSAWTTRLRPRLAMPADTHPGSPIPPLMSYQYVITISRPSLGRPAEVHLCKGPLC